jgi:hypothetical protein
MFTILPKDLRLIKKSARGAPKLLSQDQMDRRVETLEAFVKMVQDNGRNFLGKIIMINELALSMHMLKMKLPSKQWLKKGTSGPINY